MAILSPKPQAMPEFAAEAMVRKLQANAWVMQSEYGFDDQWTGSAGFSIA